MCFDAGRGGTGSMSRWTRGGGGAAARHCNGRVLWVPPWVHARRDSAFAVATGYESGSKPLSACAASTDYASGQTVALEVGGSIPLAHPIGIPAVFADRSDAAPRGGRDRPPGDPPGAVVE